MQLLLNSCEAGGKFLWHIVRIITVCHYQGRITGVVRYRIAAQIAYQFGRIGGIRYYEHTILVLDVLGAHLIYNLLSCRFF